jgi:hypothetical protein
MQSYCHLTKLLSWLKATRLFLLCHILIPSLFLQLPLSMGRSDQNDTSYFGPITGRIAQRVARGRFVLDGKVYHMHRNDGRNTIHGTSIQNPD